MSRLRVISPLQGPTTEKEDLDLKVQATAVEAQETKPPDQETQELHNDLSSVISSLVSSERFNQWLTRSLNNLSLHDPEEKFWGESFVGRQAAMILSITFFSPRFWVALIANFSNVITLLQCYLSPDFEKIVANPEFLKHLSEDPAITTFIKSFHDKLPQFQALLDVMGSIPQEDPKAILDKKFISDLLDLVQKNNLQSKLKFTGPFLFDLGFYKITGKYDPVRMSLHAVDLLRQLEGFEVAIAQKVGPISELIASCLSRNVPGLIDPRAIECFLSDALNSGKAKVVLDLLEQTMTEMTLKSPDYTKISALVTELLGGDLYAGAKALSSDPNILLSLCFEATKQRPDGKSTYKLSTMGKALLSQGVIGLKDLNGRTPDDWSATVEGIPEFYDKGWFFLTPTLKGVKVPKEDFKEQVLSKCLGVMLTEVPKVAFSEEETAQMVVKVVERFNSGNNSEMVSEAVKILKENAAVRDLLKQLEVQRQVVTLLDKISGSIDVMQEFFAKYEFKPLKAKLKDTLNDLLPSAIALASNEGFLSALDLTMKCNAIVSGLAKNLESSRVIDREAFDGASKELYLALVEKQGQVPLTAEDYAKLVFLSSQKKTIEICLGVNDLADLNTKLLEGIANHKAQKFFDEVKAIVKDPKNSEHKALLGIFNGGMEGLPARVNAARLSDHNKAILRKVIDKHQKQAAGYEGGFAALYSRAVHEKQMYELGVVLGQISSDGIFAIVKEIEASDLNQLQVAQLFSQYPAMSLDLAKVLMGDKTTISSEELKSKLSDVACRRRGDEGVEDIQYMLSDILAPFASIMHSLASVDQLQALIDSLATRTQSDVISRDQLNDLTQPFGIANQEIIVAELMKGDEQVSVESAIVRVTAMKNQLEKSAADIRKLQDILNKLLERAKDNPRLLSSINKVILEKGTMESIAEILSEVLGEIFASDVWSQEEKLFIVDQLVMPVLTQMQLASSKLNAGTLQVIHTIIKKCAESPNFSKKLYSNPKVLEEVFFEVFMGQIKTKSDVLKFGTKLLRLLGTSGIYEAGRSFIIETVRSATQFKAEQNPAAVEKFKVILRERRKLTPSGQKINILPILRRDFRETGLYTFVGQDLANLDLSNTEQKGVVFEQAILNAKFAGTHFSGCVFTDCIIPQGLNLQGVSFDLDSFWSFAAAADKQEINLNELLGQNVRVVLKTIPEGIDARLAFLLHKYCERLQVPLTEDLIRDAVKAGINYRKLPSVKGGGFDLMSRSVGSIKSIGDLKKLQEKLATAGVLQTLTGFNPTPDLSHLEDESVAGILKARYLNRAADKMIPSGNRIQFNLVELLEKVVNSKGNDVADAITKTVASKLFGNRYLTHPDRLNDVTKIYDAVLEIIADLSPQAQTELRQNDVEMLAERLYKILYAKTQYEKTSPGNVYLPESVTTADMEELLRVEFVQEGILTEAIIRKASSLEVHRDELQGLPLSVLEVIGSKPERFAERSAVEVINGRVYGVTEDRSTHDQMYGLDADSLEKLLKADEAIFKMVADYTKKSGMKLADMVKYLDVLKDLKSLSDELVARYEAVGDRQSEKLCLNLVVNLYKQSPEVKVLMGDEDGRKMLANSFFIELQKLGRKRPPVDLSSLEKCSESLCTVLPKKEHTVDFAKGCMNQGRTIAKGIFDELGITDSWNNQNKTQRSIENLAEILGSRIFAGGELLSEGKIKQVIGEKKPVQGIGVFTRDQSDGMVKAFMDTYGAMWGNLWHEVGKYDRHTTRLIESFDDKIARLVVSL